MMDTSPLHERLVGDVADVWVSVLGNVSIC